MASALVGLVALACIASVMFFVAALITNSRRRRDEAWRQVADARKLEFFASTWTDGPSMAGIVNGFFVSVDTQRVGGQNSNHVTRYTIGYPSSVLSIGMTRQTGALHFTIVKRLVGKNDVEIGDSTFDDNVLIDSTDPVAAARYLSPIRRSSVLHLFAHRQFTNPKITDSAIIVDTAGVESSNTNLNATITSLLETAIIMSAPTDVDLAAVEASLPSVSVQDSVRPDASALAAPNDDVEVDVDVDVDVEVDVEVEVEVEDEIEPEPQPEPELAPVLEEHPPLAGQLATNTPPALDQRSVVSDLFESGRMGYETTAHFDEVYAGEPIEWTGEVDMVRDVRHDSDFGDVGTKVTVVLDHNESTPRSRRAKAVVHLVGEATVTRRDSVTISGTLLRADRFTRSLYIANGSATPANAVDG